MSQCCQLPVGQQSDEPEPSHRFARTEAVARDEGAPLMNVGGNGLMVKLLVSQLVPANTVDDVDDLASLVHVHDAALLASLRARASRGVNYTWVGDLVLVATRPLNEGPISPLTRWQPLERSVIAVHASSPADSRPPHILQLAESLYRRAVLQRADQAVLLLGDRGAGKTHQFEQVLRYLCCRAATPIGDELGEAGAFTSGASGGSGMPIGEALLAGCAAICPLVEAHSPARVCASQCGQSAQLMLSSAGRLLGAQLRCHTLNLSRLLGSSNAPRAPWLGGGMHIFSLLLAAPSPLALRLRLEPVCASADAASVAGRDEAALGSWLSCVQRLGMAELEREQLLQLLAAVLHLGTIDVSASSDHCFADCSRSDAALGNAAELLRVEVGSLEDALTRRSVSSDAQSEGRCTMPLYPLESLAARDSLARLVFTGVVQHLIARSNSLTLCSSTDACTSVRVVDFCGFVTGQHARLGALCSNYCLEKQHAMVEALLEASLPPEYVQAIAADDQQGGRSRSCSRSRWPAMALMEEMPSGLLHTIERQSRTPDASDESLCASLAAAHTGKQCWRVESSRHFTIHHFSGAEAVTYDAAGLLVSSRNDVSWECSQLLRSSECELLHTLLGGWPAERKQGGASGGDTAGTVRLRGEHGRGSVCREVLHGMADLFSRLKLSSCAVVCCIRTFDAATHSPSGTDPPQPHGSTWWKPSLVLSQLRRMRVRSWAVRARLGHSCAICCEALAARLTRPLAKPLWRAEGDASAVLQGLSGLGPAALCTTLALACGMARDEFWVEGPVEGSVDGPHLRFRSGRAPLLQRLCELTDDEALPGLLQRVGRLGQLATDPWDQRPLIPPPDTSRPAYVRLGVARAAFVEDSQAAAAEEGEREARGGTEARRSSVRALWRRATSELSGGLHHERLARARNRVALTVHGGGARSPLPSESRSPTLLQTVAAQAADGQQMLSSLFHLRTLTQRGAAWVPFTCTLLADGELLLMHTEHPFYSASISIEMLTGIAAAPAPDGTTSLLLRVLGRELAMRSPEPTSTRRWEEVLSQRMASAAAPGEAAVRLERRQPWKVGRLRVQPGEGENDTGGALGFGALSFSGLLEVRPTAEAELPQLAVPLARLVTARPRPPYPDLELLTDLGEKHVLQFFAEEDMLSWMGMLLVLAPMFKEAAHEPQGTPSQLEPRIGLLRPAAGLAMEAPASLATPSRRAFAAERPEGDDGDELLMVGKLEVFTEREGARRWVQCHARLDAGGLLSLESTTAWRLRLQLPLRAATLLLRLGSAQWPYLRLQVAAMVVYLQAESEQAMTLWVSHIQRVSGVRLTSQDYSSWVQLKIESSSSADTDPPWERAWLILLSSHQLMWFRSEYGPLIQGCIDLHKVSAVRPVANEVANEGHRSCLEVRAMGLRWVFSSDDQPIWQRQLLLALELCRKNAEAQRLIKINLNLKAEARQAALSSRRESCAATEPMTPDPKGARILTDRSHRGPEGASPALVMMQGWLQLSWLPTDWGSGGRCYCTLRAGGEVAVLEFTPSGAADATPASVNVADAVALYPTDKRDLHQLHMVFPDRVLRARADKADAGALAAWHLQLANHAAKRADAMLPAPRAAPVQYESWVCWRSAAVSRTWQPRLCRLYGDGVLDLLGLQLHQGGEFTAHTTQLSLTDAKEVRPYEIAPDGQCCLGFPFTARATQTARFELVCLAGVEEFDAHERTRGGQWVDILRRALAEQAVKVSRR